MSKFWRYLYPGYLWALPMTMIGFVVALLFYKARHWIWYDGILTCVAGTHVDGSTLIWGQPNAQTLGWLQIYDTHDNRLMADLRVHENVHVGQAFALGLLGTFFIPLLFALLNWPVWLGLLLGGFIGALGFNVIYAILFVYLYLKQPGRDWYWAYRNNPFEIQAYDLQDNYIENPETKPWGV